MRCGSIPLAALLLCVAAILCAPGLCAPAGAQTVGQTPAEARSWASDMVGRLAKGDFDQARSMVREAVAVRDRPSWDQALDQIVAYVNGKGGVRTVDPVEDMQRGTSILVMTHFVRLENAEFFIKIRFHRGAQGWDLHALKFNVDYKKMPWEQ